MKIKEEMQKEDKEIRVSELLQAVPLAVPVPKAACHFSTVRSRFSGCFSPSSLCAWKLLAVFCLRLQDIHAEGLSHFYKQGYRKL